MSGAVTKGSPTKGVQHQQQQAHNNPPNANSHKKSSKNESGKSDKNTDLNPKMMATAEQMQIAKIIDTHRAEDPELQKKIRQVMEITRTTEDQACMALHSREYDIEQAITLLTDGGGQTLESEWEQAGKKRKGKTPNQKAEIVAPKDAKAGIIKDGDRQRDKSEKRDSSKPEKKEFDGGDQPFIGMGMGIGDVRRGGDRGDRGGGRGMGMGGRSRGGLGHPGRGIRSDKENEEFKAGRIMTNGPGGGRGRGGAGGGVGVGSRPDFGGRGGRGGGRTFASRARGGREGDTYNTMDVWENSQADSTREAPLKVEKWGEFPSAEDWDNEEYTGSLADTKVFTPSSQTSQAPLTDTTNGVGGPPNSNHIQSSSSGGVDMMKMSSNQDAGVTLSSVVQGLAGSGAINGGNLQSGQTLDLNLLLSKQGTGASGGVSASPHTNAGVNLLASLQSSYSNSNQLSSQVMPQRKVQRPRVPQSKIPSSAVEMPDDSVTTLDVQFGGMMDLNADSSLSFSSAMQGGNSGVDNSGLMYGQGAKLDSFVSAASSDKDLKSSGHSPSPFQTPLNSQSQVSLNDPSKGNVASTITPSMESLSSLSQNQTKPQQTGPNAYGTVASSGGGSGSAFVSYGGKGAPGFPAPGFPPVTQTAAGTYSSSNLAHVTSAVPHSYSSQQPLPTQQQSYMNLTAYGNQMNAPTQPIVVSSQNPNVPYGSGSSVPQPNPYQMNYTSSGYSASGQYGSYTQKMGGPSLKDSSTDVSATVPVSSTGASGAAQMGSSIQSGSAEDWTTYGSETSSTGTSSSKMSAPASTTANTTSKVNSTIPPGMVMPPQYIVSQNTQAVPYYGMQAPVYGTEADYSLQFVPRFPPNMGYYDATNASYGVPLQPGVAGRNDGATMQAYSTTTDGRFQRSDSSTASPVPSNLPGGNTQQTMYNPAMPYFFNMMPGQHYPAYQQLYQAPMATATNASGAQHATASNHQYPNKNVYSATQYTYDGTQGGPTSDFGKNTYTSGSVGPSSNSAKVPSGSTTGGSQSTDISSSMYGKSHNMGKMNSYDKQYGTGQGYNSIGGAQPNVLGSQLGGAGMAPYGVYIPQADANNTSRQGPGGQQKGKQQQYGGGAPYWGN